jgi:hypothetical protein
LAGRRKQGSFGEIPDVDFGRALWQGCGQGAYARDFQIVHETWEDADEIPQAVSRQARRARSARGAGEGPDEEREDFPRRPGGAQAVGDYVEAHEDALSRCRTEEAPWFIIPANHKWFRNLAVSRIIVEALDATGMKFPAASFDVSKVRLK